MFDCCGGGIIGGTAHTLEKFRLLELVTDRDGGEPRPPLSLS